MRWLLLPLLVVLFPLSACGQGPATSPIEINGFFPEARELAAEIETELDKVLKDLPSLGDQEVKDVANAYIACQRLTANCEVLLQYGEPAAIDYYHRAQQARERILYLITTKRVKAIRDAAKSRREKTAKDRGRKLEKINNSIAAGDLAAARREMDKLLEEVHAFGEFLDDSLKRDLAQEYMEPLRQLRKLEKEERVKRVQEGLNERMAATAPEPDQFLTTAVSAFRDIQAKGETAAFGSLMNGPQAANAMVDRWGEVHDRMLRYTALEWIRDSVGNDLSGADEWSVHSSLIPAAEKLRDNIPAILGNLISADLTQAAENEVVQRHAEYLAIYNRLLGLMSQTGLKPIDNALQTFLQSERGQPIREYREATGDLFRWRRMVLQASQKTIAQPPHDFESLIDLPTRAIPYFNLGLEEVVAKLESTTLEQSVAIEGLYRTPLGYVSIETVRKKPVRCRISKPPSFEKEPAAILQEMFCADEIPRSMASSEVAANEVAHIPAAAGKIVSARIRALANDLAQLEEGAGTSYYPLGQLPANGALNATFLDFVIEPAWFADDHFALVAE